MNREQLKKNFEKHGFQTSFFDTKEAAVSYMAEHIKGKTVAMGGTMTAKEMKLDKVLEKENKIIWHWLTPGEETLREARHAAVYITSANGVSETGELVNIDGVGNRVAETLYGPEKTYFIVGKNKLTEDLPAAVFRAKNVAAPKNAKRLNSKTPCAAKGDRCYDCDSPGRICRATVIMERACRSMVTEVVFIDEELGY